MDTAWCVVSCNNCYSIWYFVVLHSPRDSLPVRLLLDWQSIESLTSPACAVRLEIIRPAVSNKFSLAPVCCICAVLLTAYMHMQQIPFGLGESASHGAAVVYGEAILQCHFHIVINQEGSKTQVLTTMGPSD